MIAPHGARSLPNAPAGAGRRGTPPAGPASLGPSGLQVVQSRCDWLTLAYKARLREDVIRSVVDRIERTGGKTNARAAVCVDGRTFEARATRNQGRYVLTCDDVALTLETSAAACQGWTLGVEYSGSKLARTTIPAAVGLGAELASVFGRVTGARVRRLDEAVDVAGVDLERVREDCAWITQRRARIERIQDAAQVEKEDEPAMRSYERGGRVTGVVICPGNALSLICYDKREQLAVKSNRDVQAFEEEQWTSNGWDGDSSVVRFETRFRTQALKELGAMTPDSLTHKVDALWKYVTKDATGTGKPWVRLVDRGTHSKLTNCRVSDVWKLLQGVTFVHKAAPSARVRLRGGASSAHAFGTVTSLLSAKKQLPRTAPIDETDAEFFERFQVFDPETGEIGEVDDLQLRCALECEIERVMVAAAPVVARDFAHRHQSIRGAWTHVRSRVLAARARTSELLPREETGGVASC